MHPSRTSVALIAHSSTGDDASTNGTGILCGRAWIRMYVADNWRSKNSVRSGRLRSGFVITGRISSADAN